MKPLVFVTSNKDKAKEVEEILGIPLEIKNLELPEIQDIDVEKVVEYKAQQAFNRVKSPVLVDDAGLYVHAWEGFPGAFIKYIFNSAGLDKMNKWLESESDKSITVIAALGYHDGNKVHTFTGKVKATFVDPKGDQGWGFDPYILPEGETETWAQQGGEKKNASSHRYNALVNFKNYLNKLEK